ncbi:hypothetical protein P3W45_001035 [Vairimorpha bombi]|jgi:hexokinase
MKMVKFFLYTLFIVGSLHIDPISVEDVQKIRREYANHLRKVINTPVENLLEEGLLVKDVTLDKRCLERSRSVGAIDLGGSFFKVRLIKIFVEDKKLKYESVRDEKIVYPEDCESCEYWFDWVSKQIVDIISEWDDEIDTCSLIFSYPIKYNKGGVYPTAFSKFWCFENSESKQMEIKECLNEAIQKYIKDNRKRFSNDLSERIRIETILNDSVATYFASKFVISDSDIQTNETSKDLESTSIGMVLGTGTNASFLLIKDGTRYVFNTEWASFIPEDIKLLDEEKLQIEQLPKSHNYIDILCGFKYRIDLTNLIIKERNLNLQPITPKELLMLFKNPDLVDVRKTLFVRLCMRSREILAALMSSIIKTINCTRVLIVLNGSAYKIPNEINAFLRLIKRNLNELRLSNVQITPYFREESAFMGSAYYALCHLLN